MDIRTSVGASFRLPDIIRALAHLLFAIVHRSGLFAFMTASLLQLILAAHQWPVNTPTVRHVRYPSAIRCVTRSPDPQRSSPWPDRRGVFRCHTAHIVV